MHTTLYIRHSECVLSDSFGPALFYSENKALNNKGHRRLTGVLLPRSIPFCGSRTALIVAVF